MEYVLFFLFLMHFINVIKLIVLFMLAPTLVIPIEKKLTLLNINVTILFPALLKDKSQKKMMVCFYYSLSYFI